LFEPGLDDEGFIGDPRRAFCSSFGTSLKEKYHATHPNKLIVSSGGYRKKPT